MNPSFMQSIRIGFTQQAIDRDGSNIYREKLIMQGRDKTITLKLHINTQD